MNASSRILLNLFYEYFVAPYYTSPYGPFIFGSLALIGPTLENLLCEFDCGPLDFGGNWGRCNKCQQDTLFV